MAWDLLIKFVSGDKLTVNVDDDWTIQRLKEEVISQKGNNTTIDAVKLIHKGSNLNNDSTIKSESITPSSYLVCVISKVNNPPPPQTQPTSTPTPSQPTQPVQPVQPVLPPQPVQPVPQDQGQRTQFANRDLLNELKRRGYSTSHCDFALRATNNTLADAVLLLQRVPSSLIDKITVDDPLIRVALSYNFPQFVGLLRENKLESALQLLETIQPGMTDLLRTRVEDLLDLTTNNVDDGDNIDDDNGHGFDFPQVKIEDVLAHIEGLPNNEKKDILLDMGFTEETINEILNRQSSSNPEPYYNNVPIERPTHSTANAELTSDENQAIDRLVEIFCLPRDVIVNTFLICDRNEEYTANYLTENQL